MKANSFWTGSVKLLVLVISGLVVATAFAQTADPPARVARLSNLTGTVSLQPSGATDWSQGDQNSTVTTGDRIYTDQGARAELQAGPFAVRLSEATDLTIANLDDQIMQLGLAQGTIGVSVFQLPSGNTVEIDTPNGALTVQGAGEYRVDTNPDDGSTLVTVTSGSLQVSGGDVSQTVGSGQSVRLTGNNPIQIASAPKPAPDSFDQWGQDLNRPIASSVSARYVSRDIPGYNELDNSGRWQEDPQNGPVWYPSGVASNWVPYRNGHWAYVQPWGWTWVEDEPWGFAPFHYGRWAYIGSSWGWLPGPYGGQPYYSPALVAFVGGPGFSIGIGFGGGVGVEAWFPLGPGEPYFPTYNHSDGYLRQINATNIRNVTNISTITNISNVNNINYANRRVATTAVPTNIFNSGQAVARRAIPVSAQQVARAQVIQRPVTSPTRAAMLGGRPAAAPTRNARLATTTPRPGHNLSAPASRANQRPALITKTAPRERAGANGTLRNTLPPPTRNNAPAATNAPPGARRAPAPLISKRTPPRNTGASSAPRASLPSPTRTNAPTTTSAPVRAQRMPSPSARTVAPARSASVRARRTPPPNARTAKPAARVASGSPRTSPPPARNKAAAYHPTAAKSSATRSRNPAGGGNRPLVTAHSAPAPKSASRPATAQARGTPRPAAQPRSAPRPAAAQARSAPRPAPGEKPKEEPRPPR